MKHPVSMNWLFERRAMRYKPTPEAEAFSKRRKHIDELRAQRKERAQIKEVWDG